MLRYATLIGCLLALSGCSNVAPTENRDADIQAIKDTEAAWVKDIATKDVEKWMSHYSPDATVMLPNMPALVGRDAIRKSLEPLLADPNFALTFAANKVEVGRGGDLGYSRGTYSMTLTDPKTKQPFTDHGKYLTVFKKDAAGKWLATEDIDNSDLPAPGESH